MEKTIPIEIALQICEEVRKINKCKKFSFAKGQCWRCMKYANKKGNIKVRCIFGKENNRGCHLVNKILDNEYQKKI